MDVHVEDFPQGLSRRSSQKQLQFHTGTQQGKGKRAALFHGHGSGSEEEKAGLIQYCRQIDSAVASLLNDEKAPMMVAGLDYLVSAYRQINTYQNLVEDSIQGNPFSPIPAMICTARHALSWSHTSCSGGRRPSCDSGEVRRKERRVLTWPPSSGSRRRWYRNAPCFFEW